MKKTTQRVTLLSRQNDFSRKEECPSLSGFKVKHFLGRTASMIHAFETQNDAAQKRLMK